MNLLVAFEAPLQAPLQTVQGHIGRRWRDDASVRRPLCRWMEHCAFQIAGLQPGTQPSFVGGQAIDQPIMVKMIETAPDVPFQNPFRAHATPEEVETALHRVLRGTPPAKSVGAPVGQRLRHRIQRKQVQGLLGPVGLSRNAERAAFSVLLGDVDPSERFWPVILRVQLLGLLPLLRESFQHDAVDARCAFAPIGADPFHRQKLGGERVDEQAL